VSQRRSPTCLAAPQVSSACSCERSWSDYDFIHSKRRNRLTSSKAKDLVYVFSNTRLADKMGGDAAREKYVSWDEECASECE
jgi:hypothetical protein